VEECEARRMLIMMSIVISILFLVMLGLMTYSIYEYGFRDGLIQGRLLGN